MHQLLHNVHRIPCSACGEYITISKIKHYINSDGDIVCSKCYNKLLLKFLNSYQLLSNEELSDIITEYREQKEAHDQRDLEWKNLLLESLYKGEPGGSIYIEITT